MSVLPFPVTLVWHIQITAISTGGEKNKQTCFQENSATTAFCQKCGLCFVNAAWNIENVHIAELAAYISWQSEMHQLSNQFKAS